MEDLFDPSPKIRKKLNLLPENPEVEKRGRFPSWLHRKMPTTDLFYTRKAIDDHRLPTVCEEAKCPNLPTCWSQKTATFLALGSKCTRACSFCSIDFSKTPPDLEQDEPLRIATSVKQLGLQHVVITQVARDDLEDGGALQLKKIVESTRALNPNVTIELLTSDFNGKESSLEIICSMQPEIFNHNIETVPSLTKKVRHTASYETSRFVLEYVKKHTKNSYIKSGLMLGLGEEIAEVKETIKDLSSIIDILTIGQYLQADHKKLRVKAFITPLQFEEVAQYGKSVGIKEVLAGPFVRSSFNAKELYEAMHGR